MFDTNPSQKSGAPTIRQWEEAGAVLASSLSKYLDLCISLGPDSQKDGTPQNALAIRIDSALQTLHAQLEHQLDQSRSILARTRNQLQSPISYFPSEILSEIFTHVIFDPRDLTDPIDLPYPVPMQNSLTNIYQSVHNLLGVCSTWRNVVLTRSSFWSIVPIIGPKRSSGHLFSTRLSLERSGSTDLHLAVIGSEDDLDLDFDRYASRFRSMNVLSGSSSVIRELLSHCLASGPQFQPSELSLCLDSKVLSNRVPPERAPVSLIYSFRETSLESILSSLSVLRLSDVIFDWSKIQFSHRLVELELRQVPLGSDWKFVELLTSLSSATGLRTLKLISVVTHPGLDIFQNSNIRKNSSFPKLQTLVARNLFFNTLDILLSSVKSRSHCLTLHLTRRTFEYTSSDDSDIEDAPAQRVVNLFRQVPVNTLLLEALEGEQPWLSGVDIWEILNAMPDIETLRMHDWEYNTEFCEMIQRPDISGISGFPRIKNMHLTQATIRDEEAFKEMVASYFESLEYMELAGAVVEGSKDVTLNDYLEGGEPIVAWFEENVPNFELTSNYEVPTEFCAPVWQLW